MPPYSIAYACIFVYSYIYICIPPPQKQKQKKQDADPIPAPIVPVHTSLDSNANGIVEIIRCPVPDGGKDGILDVVFMLQDPPVPVSSAREGEDGTEEGEGVGDDEEEVRCLFNNFA